MPTDLTKKIDKYAPHIRAFAFFTALFTYIQIVIEPRLIYRASGLFSKYKNFIFDKNFLLGFLKYPAGPAEMISRFLLQLYHTDVLGAALATLTALALYRASKKLSIAAGARISNLFFLIPSLAVIAVHGFYNMPLACSLWLLITIEFFFVFQKTAPDNSFARCMFFLPLFALQYFITGGTGLMFAVLAVIFAVLLRKKIIEAIFYLFVAVIIPYISTVFLFGIPITSATIKASGQESWQERE